METRRTNACHIIVKGAWRGAACDRRMDTWVPPRQSRGIKKNKGIAVPTDGAA